jgi:hypothetical protein
MEMMVGSTFCRLSLALLAGVFPLSAARADPRPSHHMNLPKPTPPGGDTAPWVVTGSPAVSTAPTVAVIGDSVARDYAYYLARELGPRGVRVVDGALSGCPVGTLQFVSRIHDRVAPLRAGACPKLVVDKQNAVVATFSPKVILWHSITEMWSIPDAKGEVPSGSPEWGRRVMAQWDETLGRINRGGAQVVVILPLWYEKSSPHRLDEPGPSVDKLRDLYTRWAARHRVAVVDVAPVACPAGPPCGPVRGVDFRPDSTHYDDPGGVQVAAYIRAQVPALARLARGR